MNASASQIIESATKAGLSITEFVTTYGGPNAQEDINKLAEFIGEASLQRIVDHYKASADAYAKWAHDKDNKHNPHRQRWLDWADGMMHIATMWAISKA